MDLEDYAQYTLSRGDLDDQVNYLTEGLDGIVALLIDGVILGIELPSSVILGIVETAPSIKGATASGRTKTARLVTGIEVQVPEYLEVDDFIKVNTESGKYMARV
jgi:elongation factor P